MALSKRFIAFCACIFTAICSGSVYLFGVYSPGLKTHLSLHQSVIEHMAVAVNVGMLVSFGGIFIDKFGPVWTIVIGSFFNVLGYGFLYGESLRGEDASHTLLIVFSAFVGQGSQWLDTAVIWLTANNFPLNKGIALGLLKFYLGLGASMLVMVYEAFFVKDSSSFLLFLSLGLSVLPFLCTPLMHEDKINIPADLRPSTRDKLDFTRLNDSEAPTEGKLAYGETGDSSGSFIRLDIPTQFNQERMRLMFGYKISTLVVAYLSILCLISSLISEALPHELKVGMVIVLLLMLPPLFFMARDTPFTGDNQVQGANMCAAPLAHHLPIDASFKSILKSVDYWLLFFIVAVIGAAGLVVIDNIAFIGESLGGQQRDTYASSRNEHALFISILSISNGVGRAAAGFLTDMFSAHLSRSCALFLAVLTMSLAQFYLIFANLEMLYLGIALVGLSFGAMWVIVATLCAEIFPFAYFGFTYSVLGIGPMCLTFIFANLAAHVYEANANGLVLSNNDEDETTVCTGHACFGWTFTVVFFSCLVACGLALVFWLRTRKLYSDEDVQGDSASPNVGGTSHTRDRYQPVGGVDDDAIDQPEPVSLQDVHP